MINKTTNSNLKTKKEDAFPVFAFPSIYLVKITESAKETKKQIAHCVNRFPEPLRDTPYGDMRKEGIEMLSLLFQMYRSMYSLEEGDDVFVYTAYEAYDKAGNPGKMITAHTTVTELIQQMTQESDSQKPHFSFEEFIKLCIHVRVDYKPYCVSKEQFEMLCERILLFFQESRKKIDELQISPEFLTNTSTSLVREILDARSDLRQTDLYLKKEEEEAVVSEEEKDAIKKVIEGIWLDSIPIMKDLITSDLRIELSSDWNNTPHNNNPIPDTNISEQNQTTAKEYLKTYSSPEAIKAYLDKKVYKQDDAKLTFSQLVYEKSKHLYFSDNQKAPTLLLCGPTGSGKTYIAETLQKTAPPFPIVIVDSTQLTSPGFKGKDTDELLLPLFQQNPGLEHGIIVFDEFDKLCSPKYTSHGENVSVEIQSSLLKLMEGTILTNSRSDYGVSTNDVTFVFCGAFSKIFDRHYEVKPHKNGIGFGASKKQEEEEILPIAKRLIDCGMLPEIAGRISLISCLEELTEEDYYTILTTMSNNKLEQIKNLFYYYYQTKIYLSEEALRAVASIACDLHLGARGMGNILERACRDNIGEVLAESDEEWHEMFVDWKTIRDSENKIRYQLDTPSKEERGA